MTNLKNFFIFKNLKELAGYLDISERQARRLKAEGMPQRPDGYWDGLVCQSWRKSKPKKKPDPWELSSPTDNRPEAAKRRLIALLDACADEACGQALTFGVERLKSHGALNFVKGEKDLIHFLQDSLKSLGLLDLVYLLESTSDRLEAELWDPDQ